MQRFEAAEFLSNKLISYLLVMWRVCDEEIQKQLQSQFLSTIHTDSFPKIHSRFIVRKCHQRKTTGSDRLLMQESSKEVSDPPRPPPTPPPGLEPGDEANICHPHWKSWGERMDELTAQSHQPHPWEREDAPFSALTLLYILPQRGITDV